MQRLKIKTLLLTGVAVLGLSGAFAWNYAAAPSHAAEGHGDSHAHEEGEEKHDEGKEEPGKNNQAIINYRIAFRNRVWIAFNGTRTGKIRQGHSECDYKE